MQTGTFMGIENGSMKIEYHTTISDGSGHAGPDGNYVSGKLITEKRIFSYPVGDDSHRDTFFGGFGPQEGTIGSRPDLPAVGQRVRYDGPTPDMSGHLMVNVYPEVA